MKPTIFVYVRGWGETLARVVMVTAEANKHLRTLCFLSVNRECPFQLWTERRRLRPAATQASENGDAKQKWF